MYKKYFITCFGGGTNMKNAIIIIIFSMFAITFTATMINIKNRDNSNLPQNTINIIDNSLYGNDNEVTLNLCSTYDEASIKVEIREIDFKEHYGKIKIPQVVGLIDKRVESKINNDIKESILKKVKSIEKYEGKKIKEVYIMNYDYLSDEDVLHSMSNVFCLPQSLNCKFEGLSGDYSKVSDMFFNYELVNGNKLHIEDLFVKNFDVSEVVSNAINDWLEDIYNEVEMRYDSLEHTDAYYDISSAEWKYNDGAWRNGEWHSKGDDYDIEITEADIIKKYDSLYKNRDNFYFDNFGVRFGLPCYYVERYAIEFDDIPDKVVIYDKYRTAESIYEDNSIGIKNILVCHNGSEFGDYYNTSFDDEYLFYQYDIGYKFHYAFSDNIFAKSEYPIPNSVLKIETELLDKVEKEIEKYRNLSQSTNKSYILFFSGQVIPEKIISSFFYSGYSYSQSSLSNILQCKLIEKVIECDKSEYSENLLQTIKLSRDSSYYPNFWTHYISDDFTKEEMELEYKEQYLEQYYYDTVNNKKYNSYDEIEKNEIMVLSPIYMSSDYYIFTDHFDDKIRENDYAIEVVRENDVKTLERAYNELFARHGHDFKSQELKEYFKLFDWYKPVEGKSVSMEELTEVERENAKYFLKIINWKKNNPNVELNNGLNYNNFSATGSGGI